MLLFNFVNYVFLILCLCTKSKGKGKAIPLQAWANPEDSRGLRLSYFKTMST